MKKIMAMLTIVFYLVGCSTKSEYSGNNELIRENEIKHDVVESIKNLYSSVFFYCASNGCDEGEELSLNDIQSTFQVNTESIMYFYDEYFEMDKDTVVATFTSEGIYIHLEAAGENTFEFNGLIEDISSFQKTDLVEDLD